MMMMMMMMGRRKIGRENPVSKIFGCDRKCEELVDLRNGRVFKL